MGKGLEAIKKIKWKLEDEGILGEEYELCDVVEKELKAFEIIEEKGLSTNEIAFIKNGESWENYVETMKELYWGDEHLDRVLKNKEEFDLLKEVLL